jgi:hypothetical protein
LGGKLLPPSIGYPEHVGSCTHCIYWKFMNPWYQ